MMRVVLIITILLLASCGGSEEDQNQGTPQMSWSQMRAALNSGDASGAEVKRAEYEAIMQREMTRMLNSADSEGHADVCELYAEIASGAMLSRQDDIPELFMLRESLKIESLSYHYAFINAAVFYAHTYPVYDSFQRADTLITKTKDKTHALCIVIADSINKKAGGR